MNNYYPHRYPGARVATVVRPIPMDGWLGSTWDFFKDTAKGAFSAVQMTSEQKGQRDLLAAQAKAKAQAGIPGWILPVALGGGALALVLLLRKRK